MGNHDEKDDAEGEQVDLLTIIRLACMDLRRHVVVRAEFGVQHARSVSAFHGAGKAEVRNLEVVVLIQEKILRLQVSVRNTLFMAVFKAVDRLLEVVVGH